MEKYIIAPPSGSQTNALGAKDRPWEEVHANHYPGLNEYLAESTGYGIVSGCEPSINGLTVTVGAGIVHLPAGIRKEVEAQTITLDAVDSTKSRIDLVYLDSNGNVQKITGEPSSAGTTPDMPELHDAKVAAIVATCDVKASGQTVVDCRSMLETITRNKEFYKSAHKFRDSVGLSSHDMRLNRINEFPKEGYSVIRDDIDWDYVEQTKGVYNFDKYLNQLNAYKTAGIKGECICTFENALYTATGESNNHTYNSDRAAAYKNFVLAFVKYMKDNGITGLRIEIINEPDLSNFFASTNFIDDYVNIVKSVYSGVKEIDATATVISCNFSFDDNKTVGELKVLYGKALDLGVADYCDAIGIHPYTRGKPETVQDRYNYIYALMKSLNIVNKPIECNEVGYSICDKDNYASGADVLASEVDRKNYIPRMILINLANNIELTCIYCYRKTGSDSSTNSEELFGIYNSDGTKTSTASAIETLVEKIGDMAYAGVYASNKNSQIMQFVDKNGFVSYVAWAYSGTETISINGRQYSIDESPLVINGYTCDIRESNEISREVSLYEINNQIVLDDDRKLSAKEINPQYKECFNCGNFNFASNISTVTGRFCYASNYSSVFGHSSITSSDNLIYEVKNVKDNKLYLYVDEAPRFSVGDDCIVQTHWKPTITGKIIEAGADYVKLDTTVNTDSNYIIRSKDSGKFHQHVLGSCSIGVGYGVLVGGSFCVGNNDNSVTYGFQLKNNVKYSAMFGCYNNTNANGVLVIGNGTEKGGRSNAFRVTADGAVYGQSAFNSTGADYAEYFEWKDGNANSDDRVGLFVTMDGEKIRIANNDDAYIIGVVSGAPAIIGNSYNDQWRNMYVTDEFGRVKYEDVMVPAETDGDGNIIRDEHVETRARLNPDYDASKSYDGRESRKEWSAVGMLGVLAVKDDGTCEVNGYCKPTDDGMATKSDTGYRVVARIADNIIKVLFR